LIHGNSTWSFFFELSKQRVFVIPGTVVCFKRCFSSIMPGWVFKVKNRISPSIQSHYFLFEIGGADQKPGVLNHLNSIMSLLNAFYTNMNFIGLNLHDVTGIMGLIDVEGK